MAFPIVPALLGGAGLLQQGKSNSRARNDASQADQAQAQLLQRQSALFDRFVQMAQNYKAQGAFSADRRLADYGAVTNRLYDRDVQNGAGRLAIAGYREGDSEAPKRLDALRANTAQHIAEGAGEVRRQAMSDEFAAFSQANPGVLNAGIQAYGQRAQDARSRVQPLGPAVGALAQAFIPQNKVALGGVRPYENPDGTTETKMKQRKPTRRLAAYTR